MSKPYLPGFTASNSMCDVGPDYLGRRVRGRRFQRNTSSTVSNLAQRLSIQREEVVTITECGDPNAHMHSDGSCHCNLGYNEGGSGCEPEGGGTGGTGPGPGLGGGGAPPGGGGPGPSPTSASGPSTRMMAQCSRDAIARRNRSCLNSAQQGCESARCYASYCDTKRDGTNNNCNDQERNHANDVRINILDAACVGGGCENSRKLASFVSDVVWV